MEDAKWKSRKHTVRLFPLEEDASVVIDRERDIAGQAAVLQMTALVSFRFVLFDVHNQRSVFMPVRAHMPFFLSKIVFLVRHRVPRQLPTGTSRKAPHHHLQNQRHTGTRYFGYSAYRSLFFSGLCGTTRVHALELQGQATSATRSSGAHFRPASVRKDRTCNASSS